MPHIKRDFPFFKKHRDLIYLDNAATTQKPQRVIDAVTEFYEHDNAPVHRGIYSLAERATEHYERARSTVARFIGADDDELVFTKGTTEAINFVATAWASRHCKPDDEIIITELEHHSNIVPWIRLEKTHGVKLRYIPITEDGTLNYQAYLSLLSEKTKLVACTHTSNVLGTHVDLPFIIFHAHEHGARVLVDAAQAVGRVPLQVHQLKADFLAFSAHKMFGPTGIGVLYIARHMQSEVEPYQVGGGMVYEVDFHDVSWAKPPLKYEAGTPLIAQAQGFEAAINYIEKLPSFHERVCHEAALCAQLIHGLNRLSSLRLLGPLEELKKNGHMVSFVSDRMHPHDIAAYLDSKQICVRAGNHCAQPLHKALGLSGSVRISTSVYTQEADIDAFLKALSEIPDLR